MPPKIRAVLFDLDGTLLDTAPDMVGALNQLRTEYALEPLPFDAVRGAVSHGAARVVKVGFPARCPARPGCSAAWTRYCKPWPPGT
jgi:phosphoglycolate phosphatase